MNALEAIADAIMMFEGWSAGSRSNRNRNPGNLRSSPLQSGEDPQRYAVFESLPVGYNALLADLEIKFSGHSSSCLTPDSTLADLFQVYAPEADGNHPLVYADFVADWISKALNQSITPATTLKNIWTPREAVRADPAN